MTTTNKLNDPNLSPEEEDAIIGAFVRRHEREALRGKWTKKLAQNHDVQRETKPVKKEGTARIRRLTISILSLAAAVLLLLFVVVPNLQRGEPGAELLAVYVEAPMDNVRGGGTNPSDSLRQVLTGQYITGEFSSAVSTAERLVLEPDAAPNDRLHLGYAYLNADRFTDAEKVFGDLLENAPELLTEARFYLALTLLETDRKAAAFELLELIRLDDGAALHSKAQKLLSASW